MHYIEKKKLPRPLPRNEYSAFLEPKNHILHIGGQVGGLNREISVEDSQWQAFEDYCHHLQNPPMACMSYIGLKDNIEDYFVKMEKNLADLENQLNQRHNPETLSSKMGLQVGLCLTFDGQPNNHYEHEITEGLLDEPLDRLLNWYQQRQCPIYLRIGYECNGTSWNGYLPEPYKEAFIYIAKKVKEINQDSKQKGLIPNIATVWNISMDYGNLEYAMKFFPGNDYIDWWSINPLDLSHFYKRFMKNFLSLAHEAGKPVMLGEVTARPVGTLRGMKDWNKWFAAYFRFIYTNPGIKATSYINWNWPEISALLNQPWETWGDGRIQNHPIIKKNYDEELSKAVWANYGFNV